MGQEKPGYIIIKAGIYTPTDDLDDFDTDFNGEVTFGGYLNPNFALEGGVGYFKTEASFSGVDPIGGSYDEDDEVTAIPITLTAKGLYPGKTFEFYGGGGAGVYFANFESDVSTTSVGDFSFDDDDTVFGLHVLAGVNVNVSEVVFVGVEGKYIWTEEGKVMDTVLGIPVSLEANLNGYIVTGNIGFRF